MKKSDYLTCTRCGRLDTNDRRTVPHYVGTAKAMRCRDCGEQSTAAPAEHVQLRRRGGYALLCRRCCPTGHGTRPAVAVSV
jgi:hypothetical protein